MPLSTEYQITNGPSIFELMLGLFDNTARKPRVLRFLVAHNAMQTDLKLVIDSVEREDGSGDSWNISGHSAETTWTGYYSTKSRNGTLTATEKW